MDSKQAAIELAESILLDIETQSATISVVVLKCARLARLLNDTENRLMFTYEAGGYPSTPDGVLPEVFELGRKAGRVTHEKTKDGVTEKVHLSSVEQSEQTISALQRALEAANDPDVSIHSANPNQFVFAPKSNADERTNRTAGIQKHALIVGKSRSLAYEYATNCLFELKFSNTASDIFDRTRSTIDEKIIKYVGKGIQKTESISENLRSDDPENWANAVHSCRRLLQEIADTLLPPQEDVERSGKTIKMGAGNYINRLIAFIDDRSKSSVFHSVVGSNISFIGDRLDSIFVATQKGSHSSISSRIEAERYVIYTFLIVGDILSLFED